MAQSGYTPISLYYTTTAAAVPTSGNLVAGELALNTNDGKLYYKNSSGVVTLLAGATAGPAGGSTTQVQYNNAGVLAGITGATTNGTALTLSSALTYGGVTLSNSVTGTGSMMLSASPTTTGTLTAAAINASGLVAMAGAATVGTTLSVTGNATVGAEMFRSTATGYLRIAGGTESSGGTILLWGESHATYPNLTQIGSATAGATVQTYGGSGTVITTVASTGLSVTGTLSVSSTSTMAAINASGVLTVTVNDNINTLVRSANTNNALWSFNTTLGTPDFVIGLRGTSDSDFHIFSYGNTADALKITRATGAVTIPGTLDVTGASIMGGISSTGAVFVNATTADLGFRTAGVDRWIFEKAGTESGSNAGGDLTLYRYADNGSFLGTAMNFVRSSGAVTMSGTLGVTSYATTDAYFWSKGVGSAGGLFLGSGGSSNGQISQASSGSSSITTYIGNQTITTISDARLKDNIVPTTRNALDLLNQWEIVDHTWNDPSDQCENNRNMRGVWTGAIAQQVQPITPWLVNKPLTDVDENGEINTWSVDYGYAVPLLVKAIQELAADFQSYKSSHP